jgi:hypothetical protein
VCPFCVSAEARQLKVSEGNRRATSRRALFWVQWPDGPLKPLIRAVMQIIAAHSIGAQVESMTTQHVPPSCYLGQPCELPPNLVPLLVFSMCAIPVHWSCLRTFLTIPAALCSWHCGFVLHRRVSREHIEWQSSRSQDLDGALFFSNKIFHSFYW